MILCIGDIVPPTTEKAKVLRRILYFTIIMQVILGGTKMYFDFWRGIIELLPAYLLW